MTDIEYQFGQNMSGPLSSTDHEIEFPPFSQEMSQASSARSSQDTASSSQRKKRKPKLPKRDRSISEVCNLQALSDNGKYLPAEFTRLREEHPSDLAIIHHVFKESRKLIVIVGAGISVAAGIPDFRSKLGLFRSLKDNLNLKTTGKAMFDASVYRDGESISNFHTTIKELFGLCTEASPTPFHYLLSSIVQDQRLTRIYTQNIDCLDCQLPGMTTKNPLTPPWPKTIQLHGTIRNMVCSKCHYNEELDPNLFSTGGSIPECPECKELDSVREVAGKRTHGIGKLRPKIVLYNEANPDSEAIGSVTEVDLNTRPDGLLVVGTTLKIPGVRRMVKEMAQAVHAANGAVVWMNIDDPSPTLTTQFEDYFDLFVKGDCQVIPQLLEDYEKHEAVKMQETIRLRQERKRKAELRAQEKLRKQLQQSQLNFAITKPGPTPTEIVKKMKLSQESIPLHEMEHFEESSQDGPMQMKVNIEEQREHDIQSL